jgi:TM2 domain-containing membrane protein YozV
MILFGVALVAIAVLFRLPGALRFFLGAAGVGVAILGFCFALGVTRVGIKASGDGGIEASADMPTGYTHTMTISKSLRGGSSPAKFGHPPPREGVMPPKDGKMPSKRAP